jgi:pyruvate formate lyase activating enzyme
MNATVRCDLCPKYCVIEEGQSGDCRIRVNIGGKLVATTYGRASAVHIDPIEKKPLNHFHPATTILSIATAGCNLHCAHCQNWQLSQQDGTQVRQRYKASPEDVVKAAQRQGCPSIAYTYSDPVIFYEYFFDTAVRAHAAGLHNVMVTAGYINPDPMRRLGPFVDAANVDLKGFTDAFYRKNCGATLKPVLDTLVLMKELGIWVEVTNLIIPTQNDDIATIRSMCQWMLKNLGPDTPLHFSRFRPMYQVRNIPATPTEALENARREALDVGLHHVYVGNLFGHDAEHTFCPADNTLLVKRVGYKITENNVKDGKCPTCQRPVAGRWST